MSGHYITKIFVRNSRNVQNFNIDLDVDKRQHLIITGKNGSGKTSLLLELNKYLNNLDNGNFLYLAAQEKSLEQSKKSLDNFGLTKDHIDNLNQTIKNIESWFDNFGGTQLSFSSSTNDLHENNSQGRFLLAFFGAKRHAELKVPSGVNKIHLQQKYGINQNVNIDFIQYIVNLKADRSFARDDNELDVVENIDNWFRKFEGRLQFIFDQPDLRLYFDRSTYNFDIILEGEQRINFNTLSDGYSAIISIITELILRMEFHNVKNYDIEGIVIIDEIETHLHVDLQKKILPFLIDFFPKIQFIVTTHSPFVISSVENVVVCDLEKRIVTSDLTGYSYDTLLESYFDSDKYSDKLKQKMIEFEALSNKEQLLDNEKDQLIDLKTYLNEIPKFLSDELAVKIQQIQLKSLKSS
jgi:energy-coupling factor transporter ATP-binding protein EcfA2